MINTGRRKWINSSFSWFKFCDITRFKLSRINHSTAPGEEKSLHWKISSIHTDVMAIPNLSFIWFSTQLYISITLWRSPFSSYYDPCDLHITLITARDLISFKNNRNWKTMIQNLNLCQGWYGSAETVFFIHFQVAVEEKGDDITTQDWWYIKREKPLLITVM